MYGVGETHLVGGHRERVNVTLFRGVAVWKAELRRIEQLWSHVTDDSWFRRCGTARLHDCGVGYDPGDPEVTQACRTIIRDQDVSLGQDEHQRATRAWDALRAHRIDITVDDA